MMREEHAAYGREMENGTLLDLLDKQTAAVEDLAPSCSDGYIFLQQRNTALRYYCCASYPVCTRKIWKMVVVAPVAGVS